MAKKGQTFHTYAKERKREVIHLKLAEGWSYRRLREYFGILTITVVSKTN
ncbi:hypothetical protein [Parageobacillus thermoglucosidasius]|jgi:transposase|nr:hypothetical protein [Parageobacillus thermoglucosidasius]